MNMYTAYTSASDYFQAVLSAVEDEQKKSQTIKRLEERELALPSGISGKSRTSAQTITTTDIKLDLLERWKKDIEQDEQLIDSAYKLLYGANENGGLCGLLGVEYAEVLELYYIQRENWRRVSWRIGKSRRRVYDLKTIAFEFLDSNGLTETAEGVGMAL